MKTVELSAALGQAQVVENLKNFVGVDAQGAAALMTPERLAAVAGESIKKVTFAKTDANLNTTIGSYVVNLYTSDCLNYPSGLKDFVILEVFVTQKEETLYILQRLTGFSGRIYTRSKVAAEEWSNWVMI